MKKDPKANDIDVTLRELILVFGIYIRNSVRSFY